MDETAVVRSTAHGLEERCSACEGHGWIEHECSITSCDIVHMYLSETTTFGGVLLTIRRCRPCKRLWKVFSIWRPTEGGRHIWVEPGTSKEGVTFTLEEAARFS